jgi:alkaline phosphatase
VCLIVATPAAFASHVPHRDMEDLIALHEIGNTTLGRTVDLMMGGGLCHFLPKSAMNSCRTDDLNVIELAQEIGWSVHTNVTNLRHFKASNVK